MLETVIWSVGRAIIPRQSSQLEQRIFARNMQSFSLDLVPRDVLLSPPLSSRTAEGQAKALNVCAKVLNVLFTVIS